MVQPRILLDQLQLLKTAVLQREQTNCWHTTFAQRQSVPAGELGLFRFG